MITRSRNQLGDLRGMLMGLGAEVLVAPAIEIADPPDWAPVDAAIVALDRFDWLVFASGNAIERFVKRVRMLHGNLNGMSHVRVAVVGRKSAEMVQSFGLRVDLCPRRYTAAGLAEQFAGVDMSGMRVLIPRAEKGRRTIPDALRAQGARVREVVVYRTVKPPGISQHVVERLKRREVDLIVFSSPSAALNCVDLFKQFGLPELTQAFPAACIGPTTAETARSLGFDVVTPEAEQEVGIAGLVDSIRVFFINRVSGA